MTTTPRLRGRAAIVKAWNDLPDAWRCHPALKQLHQAAQDCEDAGPTAAPSSQVAHAEPGQQWKAGNEFLPYHHQASHVSPDYRDGWNHCYQAALAQYPKAGDATYSIDLDPAGIRALVADAISGALALGAQNESPAPEGHWLGHFWQLGRQHDEWRATVWAVARALNCLPSTFSDANGHVLRAAERLMAERSAIPAPAAADKPDGEG